MLQKILVDWCKHIKKSRNDDVSKNDNHESNGEICINDDDHKNHAIIFDCDDDDHDFHEHKTCIMIK